MVYTPKKEQRSADGKPICKRWEENVVYVDNTLFVTHIYSSCLNEARTAFVNGKSCISESRTKCYQHTQHSLPVMSNSCTQFVTHVYLCIRTLYTLMCAYNIYTLIYTYTRLMYTDRGSCIHTQFVAHVVHVYTHSSWLMWFMYTHTVRGSCIHTLYTPAKERRSTDGSPCYNVLACSRFLRTPHSHPTPDANPPVKIHTITITITTTIVITIQIPIAQTQT